MSTVLQMLEKTRGRIEKPENWTQKSFARRADGVPCPLSHPEACSWCLHGSIMLAMKDVPGGYDVFGETCDLLNHLSGGTVFFNDSHSHAEVLGLLDEAIAEVKK